ncbi:hypothetical protein EJ08DRAFT_682480 [Tothia fuscella]|uniref:Uncharacterized protein n=1 Tax=Tothia fuscella TaxID=1048955 RepID=A0A9P4NIH3_9PEZI|nr:hypothetical protein EJ08DRAFT_682480 [Tothia fuscella]
MPAGTASPPSSPDLRELDNVFKKWQKDIPLHFQASSLAKGDSSSITSLTIQVTSLQYQLIFFQAPASHTDHYDESLVAWARREKTNTAFDLAAIFRLATVHDLARHAPQSLFVPVSIVQLVSIQAKTACDAKCEKGAQLAAKTDVQILLVYLERCGPSRSYARWFYEGLFDYLKRAGIVA